MRPTGETALRRVVAVTLKQLRETKGLSQEELGARASLDRTYVSGVERLHRNLTLDSLARLLSGLEVSYSHFFRLVINLLEASPDHRDD